MNWAAGYMTEIEYTKAYCLDLNPLRQRLAFLASGLAPGESKFACELGFGQGLSVNIHATDPAVQWWGTDFNPAQAGFARQLATRVGSGAKLFDQDFVEFCARPDLPDFDIIGLHGIWSWISDENRAVVVDFIRRRLNVGGVLYISYNTLPGWAAFAPLQHLLKRHNDVMSAPGQGVLQRMTDAIAFSERLLGTDPLYLRANAKIGESFKRMRNENQRYLAHEYFNDSWNPMHVAEVARWVEPTKCVFACSANFLDQIDALNLTPSQQELVGGIGDPMFRETIRDFVVNQRFRRDYWVKGARRLSRIEQTDQLRAERVILTTVRSDIPLTIAGARYKVPEVVYGPILDCLSDYQSRSLAEIEHALSRRRIDFAEVIRAILILAGAGYLQPAQSERRAEEANPYTDSLNAVLMDMARDNAEISVLASPVSGGAISVSRIDQLFLRADQHGRNDSDSRAEFVWSILRQQGERLEKEGKVIESDEDNRAELTVEANNFAHKVKPMLTALGIG
jgi:SAM-dependent methyltransferase